MAEFEIFSDKSKGEKCWSWRFKVRGKAVLTAPNFDSKEKVKRCVKQLASGACSPEELGVKTPPDFDARLLLEAEICFAKNRR